MHAKPENHFSDRKVLIFLNIFSLFLFLFILYAVLNDSYLHDIDTWVHTHIIAMQTPVLTKVIVFFTNLSGVLANIVFAILLLLYLSYKKCYEERRFYLYTVSGAVLLFLAVKQMVGRIRPDTNLIEVINYSFPSGHATLSMTTVLLLYIIFIKKHSSYWVRYSILILFLLWALFIAFTRVYLNVHWLSDVVAGLALGIFWVSFMWLFLYQNKL